MASSVVSANIQLWRQKAAAGELTQQEMREAIRLIREERVGAGLVSAASKERKAATAAKKQPINSDDLLGQLGIEP